MEDTSLPVLKTVIGWSSSEVSQRLMPRCQSPATVVSPLKQMLQQRPQCSSLPRLRIKTKAAGDEVETAVGALQCRTTSHEECSSSLHTSSPPISIPYDPARPHSVLNVEGQILEDLSLDPEAFRTRLPSSNGGARPASASPVIDCDMSSAASHSSTIAEAQLQGLLRHAKQGQGELHMVSVVEAMLHAAEEHDRLLLDCEHELLHHPDDCMFDIDLPAALPCN